MTLAAGTRIGPYEVLGPLGAGGMGEVYRARDERLSRSVALKVLPGEISDDKNRLERFEKEARAASSLNHPNIVTIYDVGSSGPFAYIAMELVEGKTLRELLEGGPLALRRHLSLAAQIGDGLARAHAAGIVHRDLKPENLMVTKDGFVKILDFGLAKLVPTGFESAEGSNLATVTRGTEPGTVMGTVGYMSPEQASGHPTDFRSDQFSLGAILYEMATGKRAFDRPTAVQTLSSIIQDDPEPISAAAPRIPANLVWIIERCLAKDPEDRYGSTKDLARDLAGLRDHASAISVSGVVQPAPRRFRPSGALFAGTFTTGILLAAATFFAGQRLQLRRDREAPPPPVRALTFRRGFLTGARFAPDGQTIVYSAAWDGKPSELFTTRVGSTDSRPLGIFPAGILAISSAGELAISLGCENRWEPCFGTLARVPLAGGAPREVLADVASADWSPDGKDLAAIHSVGGLDRLEYPIGKVIYQSEAFLSSVRVSPKGDLVAFIDHPSRDSDIGELCVVDRGGRKKVLSRNVAHVTGILWSPTGDEVFCSTRMSAGTRSLGRTGFSLSGRVRSTPWIRGLDDVSREGQFLDTGEFTFMRADILAVVPGTSKERNLSWLDNSLAADLSPDGRQILFYEYERSDGSFATYLRKTDGSDAKMLGEGKALALSPDEKWALVERASPQPHLVLLPTGAGEPRNLPGDGIVQYHWASFFPDGKRIVFAAEQKGKLPRSYIQDVAGGRPRPFGEEGMRATLVSPDGREIAGSTLEGLHLIYRADGEGRARAIGGAEPGDFLVQWSADGKSIYVRGPQERPLMVYQIDLATGKREAWKELAPPDMAGFVEFVSGPKGVRLTPDGRFYAYSFYNDLERLTLTDGGKNWWK